MRRPFFYSNLIEWVTGRQRNGAAPERFQPEVSRRRRAPSAAPRGEDAMLTGSLLWLIGVPIPIVILLWFFFLRGR